MNTNINTPLPDARLQAIRAELEEYGIGREEIREDDITKEDLMQLYGIKDATALRELNRIGTAPNSKYEIVFVSRPSDGARVKVLRKKSAPALPSPTTTSKI